MSNDITPFDRPIDAEGERAYRLSPRSLLAPAAGVAGAAAGLLFEDAEANRRHRNHVQRERNDRQDDRQDDRHDLREARHDARNADVAERHDVHHDSWGGDTEAGSGVGRTPSQHIRNDFDAWS